MVKKRKTRSGKRRKQRKSPGAGILSLLIGGFSLVCIVLSLSGEGIGFVGNLGAHWGQALLWLFGYPALALCLISGYFGVELIRGSRERLFRRMLGLLLLTTIFAIFFSLSEQPTPVIFPHGHGGIVGSSLAGLFSGAIGSFGTVLLGLILGIFGFTLASGVPFRDLYDGVAKLFKRRTPRRPKANRPQRATQPRRTQDERVLTREEPLPTAAKPAPQPPPVEVAEEAPPALIPQPLEPTPEGEEIAPPPLSLLGPLEDTVVESDQSEQDERWHLLQRFLESHRLAATILDYTEGPTLGRFELRLAPGERIASLEKLTPELSLSLRVPSVRLAASPERGTVTLELPRSERSTVSLRQLVEDPLWQRHESPLAIPLGLTREGTVHVADLAEMPHLLVAGTTGSGKSVFLNALLLSLLARVGPQSLRLVLIDPGRVELAPYGGLPHLLYPPVEEPTAALEVLEGLVEEMDKRYERLAGAKRRSLTSFNAWAKESGEEPLPWIVVAIDELAELMHATKKAVETPLSRIAQMARAVGIHLVIATQRPSVDVVTGVLKANFPTRIAFKVRSKTDSRVILDEGGAESLLGKGDLLYLPVGASSPIRLQGGFVDEEAVLAMVQHWQGQ